MLKTNCYFWANSVGCSSEDTHVLKVTNETIGSTKYYVKFVQSYNKDNSMAPIEIVLVFFIALEIVESGVFSVSYVLALELKTEI